MKFLLEKINTFFFKKEEVFILSFSPLSVLCFILFFCFGFYGYFTDPSFGFVASLGITIFFLLLFLTFYILKEGENRLHFSVTHSHVRLFFLHTIILVLITSPYIYLPLSGDNFYHIQQAFIHGIKITEKLTSVIPVFNNVPFAFLLQGVSLGIIIFFGCLIYLLRKRSLLVRVIIYGSLFVFLRMMVLYFGGNTASFPPFRLFPLLFGGAFFGIWEFSFRFMSLLVTSFLSVYLFEEIKKERNALFSWFTVLAIFSIPLLLHVSTLVESSVYAFVGATLVLLKLLQSNLSLKDYQILLLVVAVTSSVRVSVFVLLVPIFIHFLFSYKKSIEGLVVYTKTALPPLLFIACFFIVPLIQGSTASYQGEAYPVLGILADSSFFERVWQAFQGGYVYAALYNSLQVLIFIPLILFFLLKRNTIILYLLFFCLSLALFFSISPGLWGNGRYQAEYALPLVVVALFVYFVRVQKIFAIIMAAVLVGYNLVLFYSLPQMNKSLVGLSSYFDKAKNKGDYFVISEMPFDYEKPLTFLRVHGFSKNAYYVPGDGYSYITKIIAGYSVSDLAQDARFRNEIGIIFDTDTAVRLTAHPTIRHLVIHRAKKDATFSNELLIKKIDTNVWQLEKTYTETVYGSVIEIYSRKEM
ncbi:MAG: hypothetical protein RI935_734 [Candidatus Parcubacteria bacterium]|jgi:hypothetical protein